MNDPATIETGLNQTGRDAVLTRPGVRRAMALAALVAMLVLAAYGSRWDGQFDAKTSTSSSTEVASESDANGLSWPLVVMIVGAMTAGLVLAIAVASKAGVRALVIVLTFAGGLFFIGTLGAAVDAGGVATEVATEAGEGASDVVEAGRVSWWLVVIVLLATAVPAIWIWRNRLSTAVVDPSPTVEDVVDAAASMLDDVEFTDDRQAIISTYRHLETGFAAAGLDRHPSETSGEYIARIAGRVGATAADAAELAAMYRRVAFGANTPARLRSDRAEALAILRRVQAVELMTTPAP